MAALPYMQFYVADYLADTMHLTTEEHGAYLLLLLNYWQTGKPIQKTRLQTITRLSNDRWISVEDTLKEFFSDTGDSWFHKRIEADLKIARDSQKQKISAGKASAESRKNAKLEKEKAAAKSGLARAVNDRCNDRSTTVPTIVPTESQREGNGKATNKEQNRTEEKKNINTSSDLPELDLDAKPPPDTTLQRFDSLWKSWPTDLGSKGVRSDALKQFQKLKPDDLLMTRMRRALESQTEHKRACKSRGEFAENFPHVVRWIAKRRWEDELPSDTSQHSRELIY